MSTQVHAASDWHGTLRDYVLGFLLSAALTALSFWLVMGNVLNGPLSTAWLIMGLAAVQMIVQVRFFLHVSARSESGWTMVSLIFTLIIVVITLTGSFWVMHHLDENMMPPHEMSGDS
jgi:cytochrome o ubiquinol oxidase operon protein cyoD